MYKLISDNYINEDITTYIGYGLINVDTGLSIPDITTSKDALANLIVKLNDLEVTDVHIFDIVEDFINS